MEGKDQTVESSRRAKGCLVGVGPGEGGRPSPAVRERVSEGGRDAPPSVHLEPKLVFGLARAAVVVQAEQAVVVVDARPVRPAGPSDAAAATAARPSAAGPAARPVVLLAVKRGLRPVKHGPRPVDLCVLAREVARPAAAADADADAGARPAWPAADAERRGEADRVRRPAQEEGLVERRLVVVVVVVGRVVGADARAGRRRVRRPTTAAGLAVRRLRALASDTNRHAAALLLRELVELLLQVVLLLGGRRLRVLGHVVVVEVLLAVVGLARARLAQGRVKPAADRAAAGAGVVEDRPARLLLLLLLGAVRRPALLALGLARVVRPPALLEPADRVDHDRERLLDGLARLLRVERARVERLARGRDVKVGRDLLEQRRRRVRNVLLGRGRRRGRLVGPGERGRSRTGAGEQGSASRRPTGECCGEERSGRNLQRGDVEDHGARLGLEQAHLQAARRKSRGRQHAITEASREKGRTLCSIVAMPFLNAVARPTAELM